MANSEQIFFGEKRLRMGWIHRPSEPSSTGLVIVPPFGFEEVCAHRSLRAFADRAATAGLLAVRFDLDGTGDSAGDDVDPDRLAAWLASIDDACEVARGAGATHLVLVGVRLGATLAALAAAQRTDVAGLVAIALPAKPKALLRELFALQGQLGLAPAPAGVPDDGVRAADEVVGFAITSETRAQLSAIDLTAQPAPPAPHVLVIDRDDQKTGNDAWVAALRARGVAVEQTRLPGYLEMMFDPHVAKVPDAIIAAAIAFAARAPAPLAPQPARAMRTSAKGRFVGDGYDVDEELVQLDDAMVGVVTRPRIIDARVGRTLLLISSGATHRIGPNRMYVRLARRLAARGVVVARIDQSGIGDSATRRGQLDNTVYSDVALVDTRVAIAWAKRVLGGEVAVSGLCSGGFHALRAGLDGEPVAIAVPINTPVFHYEPGKALDFATTRATSEAQRYRRALTEGDSWKKLLRGDVDVRAAVNVARRRVRDTAQAFALELARKARLPLKHDFPSQLRDFAGRGTARFIFAEDDPGHAMLAEQGGSTLTELEARDRVSIVSISGADHTFTARWAQTLVLDAIERAVLR